MLAVLAVAALATSLAGSAGSPGGSTVSLREYAAATHAIRVSLNQDPGALGSARRASLVSALSRLGAVRLPGVGIVQTADPELASELRSADRRGTREIQQELDVIDIALVGSHPRSVNASSLSELDSVLRDPRFHLTQSIFDRIRDWLANIIQRILDAIARFLQLLVPGASGGLLTYILVFGFLAAIVISAFMLARHAAARTVVRFVLDEAGAEPSTSTGALTRASRHVTAGDYRLALRYLVLGTMLELQEAGILVLRQGMTNREYLRGLRREIAAHEQLRAPLGELVDAFDRVWYGHLPIDEAEYLRCERLADDALRAVGREPAA